MYDLTCCTDAEYDIGWEEFNNSISVADWLADVLHEGQRVRTTSVHTYIQRYTTCTCTYIHIYISIL